MASKWKAGLLTAAVILLPLSSGIARPRDGGDWDHDGHSRIHHVLLISIDGMHAVDLLNCKNGLAGVNGGAPYCPNLAELAGTGVNYRDTSTSKPSDSFPGLTALMSGGGPRSEGVFYDVSYDRSLDGPINTTGNGVAGIGAGGCVPGSAPTGYTTEFDEGIDLNKLAFNGGAPGADPIYGGGEASLDPTKMDRDPARNCEPVYPWHFVRTNTIFGVIHGHGGYTAWTDKHPSYSSVSGHGSGGKAVDDYFAPEINSIPAGLPGINAEGVDCSTLPDQTAVSSSNPWTDSFQNIQCYDQVKVNSILHEIAGLDHSGKFTRPRPNLMGMNFQTVSVGQKLIEGSLTPTVTGGYQDAIGTPTAALLKEIEFTDTAIGAMVSALKANGIYDDTLIIITAKHGQSPIDSARYLGIGTFTGDPIQTSPATILDNAGCIPSTESPSNPTGIGPTEDDISLVWLNSACTTDNAVAMLRTQSPTTNNQAGIGEIFSDRLLTTYFNKPGLPPDGDPRTPDIVTTPDIGVFSRDDTNVIMLVSNPSFEPKTVTGPVETMQVAPTIVKALGLDPNELETTHTEGTAVLPGLDLD